MPEVATCSCGCQNWVVHSNRLECTRCGRTFSWKIDWVKTEDLHAKDLVEKINTETRENPSVQNSMIG